MDQLIPKLSSIEVPVQSLKASIEWYKTILELEVTYEGEHDAMLRFQSKDLPGLYLVQTDSTERLGFTDSRTQIKHSVVDFYTPNLEELYKDLIRQNVRVTELNLNGEIGGFGFYDLDNNLFGACNISH
ncbi:VOC family protein [Bacillus sp. RG28]|uniref:VOC family protein n=1 Tax=Gottfriedia endophytica TaxID=2820819 RepID=A0A940NJI9_9BACI|nr:VOC family protein [Gottfriedia endophytica]MBP0725575.1 VOC family protein [Gottfriedia endophytica]